MSQAILRFGFTVRLCNVRPTAYISETSMKKSVNLFFIHYLPRRKKCYKIGKILVKSLEKTGHPLLQSSITTIIFDCF